MDYLKGGIGNQDMVRTDIQQLEAAVLRQG